MEQDLKANFYSGLRKELTDHILPFWSESMKDQVHGGFFGRMDGNNRIVPDAPKGGILNARILWTFSAAYRVLHQPEYLETARYAFDYIRKHFFDEIHDGTYWSLDYKGDALETRKQIYSQAFFIYALSEFHRATGDRLALEYANRLFRLIEFHSYDPAGKGYMEALDRQWKPLDDVRLSEKDANEKKTMNTHLHVLEAYTSLYRVSNDPVLADKIRMLLKVFSEHIVNSETSHLDLFFDEGWNCKSSVISYGHDIESSWLLYEAAQVLGDEKLISEIRDLCIKLLQAAEEGHRDDGSLAYEYHPQGNSTDGDRHWWPQAEAVVGFFNGYEITGQSAYLKKATDTFRFIRQYLTDPENGEWFWSIHADGSVNRTDDKAGFWKCPYHNSRMCLELIERMDNELKFHPAC